MQVVQSELKEILQSRFVALQNLTPGYSIRMFAKELGVGVGTLSDFINGKRKLSEKLMGEMIDRLSLDPNEKAAISELRVLKKAARSKQTISTYEIPEDEYYLVSEWYYFAILNLVKLDDFNSDANWISSRLGLPVGIVEKAWTKLVEEGHVTQDDQGRWIRVTGRVKAADEVPNHLIQKSHRDTLNLAKDALNLPIEEREFQQTTFVGDRENFKKLKTLLKHTVQNFMEEAVSVEGKNNEVYRFGAFLFPLTVKNEE